MDGKESACNSGEQGLICGLGRFPGEGNVYPLQYSCLENSTDRGAWRSIVHGVAKSQTQLSIAFIVNYNHHTVLYSPRTYLSYSWKFVPFDHRSVQFSSVSQSCLTLCNPVNRSMPGYPVHHQLPEFTQTCVHRVSDAIQPSHPRSSPCSPAPNHSQHQSLFQ